MGDVVQLKEFLRPVATGRRTCADNGLIPVELAVGAGDRESCLRKARDHGIDEFRIHRLTEGADNCIYLMRITDAIRLNKRMLEREELSDAEVTRRIDLIQMLENANLLLLDSLWQSFTCQHPA